MSARLILITPGLTAGARAGIFGVDEALDAHGAAAARRVGEHLARRGAGAVLSAPETQCTQTASALGGPVTVDDQLRGWDHGPWTGKTLTEVAACAPADLARWRTGGDPVGAESLMDLVRRAGTWLTTLTDTHQGSTGRPVIAVATTAVVRACILHTLHTPLPAFWDLDIEPTASVHLTLNADRAALRWTASCR